MDPSPLTDAALDDEERRIWDLLTSDFYWDVPAEHPVQIYLESGQPSGPARLQIFEIAIATILAHLRPEFVWQVTPNRPDDGLDFLGVHRFLDDSELGIEATIKVGGQCKKRTTVNDIVGEVAGSLLRMADKISPTFFVVALSARLAKQRVERARGILERQLQRQCHILDRTQIEGLICDHLETVTEIFSQGLANAELEAVLSYFRSRRGTALPASLFASPPPRVLAGVPFKVTVEAHWARASDPNARVWWRPAAQEPDAASLIAPAGADGAAGAAFGSAGSASDPLSASCVIELVTHSVGSVELGEILVGVDKAASEYADAIPLGRVDVIETMRPRFFDLPYRAGLERLSATYEQVLAGAVSSVGVVGAGGSGKSRMCEEFALQRRRRGCTVVTVRHPTTHEEPQRILGELLTALTADGRFAEDPAAGVIQDLARYDSSLAEKAAPAIRSTFGAKSSASHPADEQGVISALVVLVAARIRDVPLIVHLQDLHWCSAEMLVLIERLQRQLSQLPYDISLRRGGVLFIFEGRVHESAAPGAELWSSAPFETFLETAAETTVTCSSFSPKDGHTFTGRLFEGRHNAHRLLADDLLPLQAELVRSISDTAGANPFHALEQIRLLRETGVIGQNPKTGLLYMIRPQPAQVALPDSVFASIALRWRYMRKRAPDLALLVWGSALLDDHLPTALFRHLWAELAAEVSVREIDGTDMLWTGDGEAREVVFRHENYFESVRRFTVSDEDRRRVVEAYSSWFAGQQELGPANLFSWARANLALPIPNVIRAKALLVSALEKAPDAADPRLTRRIQAFHLDLLWDVDERDPIETKPFLSHCEEESDLCRAQLGVDRDQAAKRIARMHARIEAHLETVEDKISAADRAAVLRALLTAESLKAQLLFNYRRPTEAVEIASHVVESVRAHRPTTTTTAWASLEMEALYTSSCAHAICGEFDAAVRAAAVAADVATANDSPLVRKVLSTYGSMLLSEDPERGEAVLRECLARWADDGTSDAALVEVHLCMSLVLQAHRRPTESTTRGLLLDEARTRLTRVHDVCRRLGLYADAGAAALVRGIVSGIAGDGDDASWFAHGVAAAAKGHQMETLWRSHINLATALARRDGLGAPSACDHALAAYSIIDETLSVYSQPERTPRFELVRIGMAAVASMLIAADDPRGGAILEQYPALRSHFRDVATGVLAPYDGRPRHFQWLTIGEIDYVLY